jgi:hypothetical protein
MTTIKVLMIIMSCNGYICEPSITVSDMPADVCMQIRRDGRKAGTRVFCLPQGEKI